MLRSIKYLGSLSCFVFLGFIPCQGQVATSFWKIASSSYSDVPGYKILYEGHKERHCYPITEWFEPAWDPTHDTYHMFHHHGVAVESELMGYRIYFDKKQTIDVYCKRTPRLELAQSYWYPSDSLLAEGYGDDILRVGGTIGVGSVNYWREGKLRHFESVGERGQRIVHQTADTAVISISDVDWQVSNGHDDDPEKRQIVNFSATYTLCAGHRDMRCDVKVSQPVQGLCTGVQVIPNKGANEQSQITQEQMENGVLLTSWGTDWPVNDTVKYAKETVGLAVFIPKEYAGELVQNKSNNLCLLLTKPQLTEYSTYEFQAHFYLTCCGASKENHPAATNATEWLKYTRRWAAELK